MREGYKNMSSRCAEESFLDQTSIALLREFFEKLAPGGSLLIQTRRHGGAREDALAIGDDVMENAHAHATLNHAWGFLASSQNGCAGNPTTGYPSGIWRAGHTDWVTTVHCNEGCIWMCYNLPSMKVEQITNLLSNKFGIHKSHDPHETYGVAVTFYILRFMLKCKNDKALTKEYISLKKGIKALHASATKAAELRVKKVLKEESFDDTKARLEKRDTDTVVANATVAATA